jgi:hypothetical protein
MHLRFSINPKLIPTIIIGLCFLSSAVYLGNKEYRQAIYWLACAVLYLVVTY